MSGMHLTRVLDQLATTRGLPKAIRTDNGNPMICSSVKRFFMSNLSIRMNSASNSYFKTSIPSHLKAITITHLKSATHSRGNAATQR